MNRLVRDIYINWAKQHSFDNIYVGLRYKHIYFIVLGGAGGMSIQEHIDHTINMGLHKAQFYGFAPIAQ